MPQRTERRSTEDRRSGRDRRAKETKAFGVTERRRRNHERRRLQEHRDGYVRLNRWGSVSLGISLEELAAG